MNGNHIPLLRPLIILIAGILISGGIDMPIKWVIYGLTGNLLMIGILFQNKNFQNLKSLLFDVLIFVIGFISLQLSGHLNRNNHFSFIKNGIALEGKILSLEKTTNAFRLNIKVIKGHDENNTNVPVFGKLQVYTKDVSELQIGAKVSLPAKFEKIEQYNNPDIFNYGKFLSHQNIHHSTFLSANEIKIIKKPPLILHLINISKAYIRSKFETHLNHEVTSGIANALIIGERKALQDDVRQLFINNGLAHLLAISGMHVGIILLIFRFVTHWIPFSTLRIVLVIIMVWIYIMLTGMQIPAIRAGFMLTVYQIGILLNRNTRSLNNVFFSALVLLCIEPKMLFQISFQLSFCAMISIFVFYPKIYNLFTPKHQLWLKLWQLIALNLSVQVFILPVSVFYFNQLPLYFLTNSLISFPFIVAIMWVGIIALIFSIADGLVSDLIFNFLDLIILAFHHVLLILNNLPFALIENIQITSFQLICWVLGILGFTHFLTLKKFGPQLAAACFLPLILISPVQEILENKKHLMTIFDHPKNIIIDIEKENIIERYALHKITANDQYYIKHPLQHALKISTEDSQTGLQEIQDIIYFKNLYKNQSLSTDSNFDICIPLVEIDEISYSRLSKCTEVVIPRNFDLQSNLKLKAFLVNHEISFYEILSKGAFIKKLN